MGFFDKFERGLNNPMTQIGLGILSNNSGHYGQFAPALAGGLKDYRTQQAASQKQLLEQLQLQQQLSKFKMDQEKWNQEQEDRQIERKYTQGMPLELYKHQYPKPSIPTGMMINAEGNWAYDPAYLKGQKELKEAGATKVNMPEIKFPEGDKGVWKEVAPLIKENYDAAKLATKDFQAAERMQQVLDSGIYRLGPGASVQHYFDQLNAKFGDGSQQVKNTRALIQGLAQSAVGARQMLAGQGQVTENEAKAVEKINSGQYDELTTDELQLVVNLIRKGAQYNVQSYSDIMGVVNEQFPNQSPYFRVRGIDPILQWQAPEFKANQPGEPSFEEFKRLKAEGKL